MNLEQLCTSLELSKRLKEIGVKQHSVFYWQFYSENLIPSGSSFEGKFNEPFLKIGEQKLMCETIASAFTAGELLKMLPDSAFPISVDYYSHHFQDELARMIGYLVFNDLVKIEDINAKI